MEYLGIFDTDIEAHAAWLMRKLQLAKSLAEIQRDQRVAEAIIMRYTDYDKILLD